MGISQNTMASAKIIIYLEMRKHQCPTLPQFPLFLKQLYVLNFSRLTIFRLDNKFYSYMLLLQFLSFLKSYLRLSTIGAVGELVPKHCFLTIHMIYHISISVKPFMISFQFLRQQNCQILFKSPRQCNCRKCIPENDKKPYILS